MERGSARLATSGNDLNRDRFAAPLPLMLPRRCRDRVDNFRICIYPRWGLFVGCTLSNPSVRVRVRSLGVEILDSGSCEWAASMTVTPQLGRS